MVEHELELYQVRFKRKSKDLLDGREANLQDYDIRYVIAENPENAILNANEIGRAIERGLNKNGHRYKYILRIASVRPIRVNGYKMKIEKIPIK